MISAFKTSKVVLIIASVCLLSAMDSRAQRQMEKLGRGVVAIRQSSTQVYVGWRLLGTDPDDTKFNLYRVTGGVTNLLAANVTSSCNFVDNGPAQASAHAWFVQPIFNGVTQANSMSFSMPAAAPVQQYINIPLIPPPDGVSLDAIPYTYNANDCSAGDVDGDGEYEIILKWDPSNSHDNSQTGFTANTFLDCYKLDGTRLWRMDFGPNMRSGAHYMDFMVYDFDGDGKAEVMCRTAPGSKDALGNYIGGVAKWQNANGPHPTFDDTHDYRFDNPNANTTNGYVLAGPEFLTVFKGDTGEELATATYYPKRDPDFNIDNPDINRLDTIWGDHYGNRLDRFLAGIAFVDGTRPSAIFCRGYYTRAFLVAWDWRNGQLTKRWVFDSNDGTPGNTAYRGQGAHSLTIGDADGDGKDEVVYGAAAIDDNGQGQYSTQIGHGDALHFSDMDPLRPGLEVWMVHETPSAYGPTGLEFRDAKTGGLIFGVDGQNADVGRGVAYDIDPRFRGYEMWGSRGGLMSATGVQITSSRPGQMNFCTWWDADFLRETLDGTTIYKWNWTNNQNTSIFGPGGLSSNNGTKSTPCLSADLFGDWREEVIWRTSDNLNLRIYTTTIPATNRFYTLMHDPQYRCAIAWQNTGYNQPPHPGFFIGQDMFPPPMPPISLADLVWRGGGANPWDDSSTANWFTNGLWVSNNTAVAFTAGKSVLFDISGSNQSPVALSGTLSPAAVTVHAPGNYSFAGSGQLSGGMNLFKAGQGRLTINNTNAYTGTTYVRGGALFVNGALGGSPVIVERRGTPEGPSQFGGAGRLGQGLTVQAGCTLTVGQGTNSPGTLTVSNGVTELGGVLNQFDLSNDPSGVTKTNDRVAITGNLTASGTNIIEVRQPDGFLGNGVYPLLAYSGSYSGGLSNFTLSGTFVQTVALTNPPGMIALLAILPVAPPITPTNLQAFAIGAFQINLTWNDNSTDEIGFLIERSTNNIVFAQIASVGADIASFSDIGLLANTTYYYRVRGTNLAGASPFSNTANATTSATPPSLTWRGDGTANVWNIGANSNWFNGVTTSIYVDGSFITFDNTGSNSPNINLSTLLQPGTLTINASKSYTFAGTGTLAGATALVKSGTGTLTLTTTNTYAGGTIISNGAVQLSGSAVGGYTANTFTLGSGPVTFRGGKLQLYGYNLADNTMGYGPITNDLVIAAGQTGTIMGSPRYSLASKVTGGGTLNLFVDYVRGDVGGDWTGFTGVLKVTQTTGTPPSSTTDDFRVATASGFPNVKLSVGTNVIMYSRAANGSIIPIGEFSGVLGAVVSANGGSGAGAQSTVTWRAGGLNTDATNAASFQTATSLIKEGNGRWTLTGTNTYTGTTTVNAGTLVINGNNSAATSAVSVNPGATLAGSGIIGGATVVNGKLSPGNSIGTITFVNNLTFGAGGTAQFEFSLSPFTNDLVRALGTVAYAGTLDVVNTGVELLQAGNRFQLFDAAGYSGAFDVLSLPDLDEGLAWSTVKLAVDGRLWVVKSTPPSIAGVSTSGGNIIFNGTGGTPDWDYYVLGSTNLALPLSQWTPVATNQFDGAGDFNCTLSIDTNVPQQFYILQLP